MKTNIKGTNIELTGAINDYLADKLSHLEKLVDHNNEEVVAQVELGKDTKHHKHGEVFRAEINLHLPGKVLRAVAMSADLYAAIDEMKDEIVREVNTNRGKAEARHKRGGREVKNLLKS